MKRKSSCISGWLNSGVLMLVVCASTARAQAPLKAINAPQGGKIVYGKVDGANSQADALVSVLRSVHKSTGEKPLIGRAFRLRYTDSVAVFFTVVDRSHENKPVAGLLIAAAAGPKQVEAALVTDDESRFGKTVNTMVKRLSEAWQPAGMELAPGARESAITIPIYRSSPVGNSDSKAGNTAYDRFIWDLEFSTQNDASDNWPLALHKVEAADGTASVSIPDGWTLSSNSGGGTLGIQGPNGELAWLNLAHLAGDPAATIQGKGLESTVSDASRDKIAYSASTDLAEAFPGILQQWRKSNGLEPAELEIDFAEHMAASPTERCVHVIGHVNPDGKGMQEMSTVMCATTPVHGDSVLLIFHTLLPLAVADRERATMGAILASYRLNQGFTDSRTPNPMAPGVGFAYFVGLKTSGEYEGYLMRQTEFDAHPIGYRAKWWVDRKNERKYGSYLFDEFLLQNSGKNDHVAAWNLTADALVKADPNRFELATEVKEIEGADY
jgi:hypothetical protein